MELSLGFLSAEFPGDACTYGIYRLRLHTVRRVATLAFAAFSHLYTLALFFRHSASSRVLLGATAAGPIAIRIDLPGGVECHRFSKNAELQTRSQTFAGPTQARSTRVLCSIGDSKQCAATCIHASNKELATATADRQSDRLLRRTPHRPHPLALKLSAALTVPTTSHTLGTPCVCLPRWPVSTSCGTLSSQTSGTVASPSVTRRVVGNTPGWRETWHRA